MDKWYRKRWFGEIIVGVLIAVVTVVVSQFFYNTNVIKQVRLEFEKETFINQIPIYNRIISIFENRNLVHQDSVIVFTKPSIYRYKVDQFGNLLEIDSLNTVSSEVRKDTLFNVSAPSFIFKDVDYNRLINDLDYIRLNSNKLSPNLYKSINELLIFLDTYPLPIGDRHTRRSAAYYGAWGKENIYTQYFEIVERVHNQFQKSMRKFIEE